MDKNKIYLHVTESLLNNVVIIFNIAGIDKEIELKDLIETYNKYNHIMINLDWFKSSVDTIKKDLDKMEINNESGNYF